MVLIIPGNGGNTYVSATEEDVFILGESEEGSGCLKGYLFE